MLACEVDVDVFVEGLGLRCAVLLRPGEVPRARLADVVRLGLVEDGDVAWAEGVAVTARTLGVDPAPGALDDDAVDDGVAADVVSAFAALLASSSSGPASSTAAPATASDKPAAAAAVITLRPKCTDRE